MNRDEAKNWLMQCVQDFANQLPPSARLAIAQLANHAFAQLDASAPAKVPRGTKKERKEKTSDVKV